MVPLGEEVCATKFAENRFRQVSRPATFCSFENQVAEAEEKEERHFPLPLENEPWGVQQASPSTTRPKRWGLVPLHRNHQDPPSLPQLNDLELYLPLP